MHLHLTNLFHQTSHLPVFCYGRASSDFDKSENRLQELKLEIASASELAASLVSSAYQQEIEVHATAKLRVEIAELLNQKLAHALKT